MVLLLTCLHVQADVTKEQARQIISQHTGISKPKLQCTEEIASLLNSGMVLYSVIHNEPGFPNEAWSVSSQTGAICGYSCYGPSTRYPLSSDWVWNLFPTFNKSIMAEYPNGSDCWWYRSKQGVLCSERMLVIEQDSNDPSHPIIGYEVVDLPLPQLSVSRVLSKAAIQNLALSSAQSVGSWAGQDYTGYTNGCITRCGEPLYTKDELGVEWVTYDVWGMSSPVAGVNSSWLTDSSKTGDFVEVMVTYDAYTGQTLTQAVFPAYSVNKTRHMDHQPIKSNITAVVVNGKNVGMYVPPIVHEGRCYIHPKYVSVLTGRPYGGMKLKNIGKNSYVAISDMRALFGIHAIYEAKLNRLSITTASVKKAN